MKIGYSPESIVGLDGMPLVGRVTLYVHDSDVKKDVFTLQGDNFVQAANPQLLDNAGRIAETLFFDAAIVDVLVEKYVGADGQMSVLSPDTDFESFDRFEIGFDPMNVEGSDKVGTIADLMDTDTSKGSVTVIGYYSAGDCAPRTYVWDTDSQDDIDGGYVVGSNVDDTGRWILLWNDEVMPSSVYGIIPGTNEANINALLNYTATVGSFLEHTAPIARFESGTYNSNVTFITTKEVAFDGKAKFLNANFEMPKMKVFGNNTDYIADFVLGSNFFGAHSSWFRTADSFWKCGAGKLVIDNTNYFTSTLLTSSVTVNGIIEGSRPLGTTYSTGAYIGIGDTCEIAGRVFRPENDYIRFRAVGHGDKAFIAGSFDAGLISDGHKVQYDYVPDLDLFEDARRYSDVMVEMKLRLGNNMTDVLDMQCRSMNGIYTGTFGVVRNVQCTDMSVQNGGHIVELHNVKATSFNAVCLSLHMYDSDITFGQHPQGCTYMYCSNCRLISSFTWTVPGLQCDFENCDIDMSFNRVEDNISTESALVFKNCEFAPGQIIYTKNLEMYGCKTKNNDIKVYPYYDGTDYRIDVVLENNLFDNANPVEFTKVDIIIGGSRDEDCCGCVLNWKIVGNTFLGNSEGLKMRFWQYRAGNHPERTFIKLAAEHTIEYSGNCGKCPAENMRGIIVTDNTNFTQMNVNDSVLYCYEDYHKRCMPKITNSLWCVVDTYGFQQTFKYYAVETNPYDNLTYDMFVEFPTWCFLDYLEQTYDGDFFKLCVGKLHDFIRIKQGAVNDKNTNVKAVVI